MWDFNSATKKDWPVIAAEFNLTDREPALLTHLCSTLMLEWPTSGFVSLSRWFEDWVNCQGIVLSLRCCRKVSVETGAERWISLLAQKWNTMDTLQVWKRTFTVW